MRLLCDAMLGDLARWLRAAGHDTVLAGEGEQDRSLLTRCAAQHRVLLTRDRRLAGEAQGRVEALALAQGGLERDARALRDELGLDWLDAPFTRCLLDNAALRPAAAEMRARVPERSRAAAGTLLTCPECGRLYWPGGHVRRMLARLAAWQDRGSGEAG